LSALPEAHPTGTVNEAVRLLKSPPSADLQSLTVRGVVTNILGFVYSFHTREFKRLKECIPSCIGSIREAHAARTALKKPVQLPQVQLPAVQALNASPHSPLAIPDFSSAAFNVDEAWSILNDSNQVINQDSAAELRDFLAQLGAYKSSDLIDCEDEDIIAMANKLKKIPKKRFLKSLRK
jgi:hypothetical protein